MKHLTMQQLEELGFKIIKSYTHDEFMTQQRKKGKITVETTWLKTGVFISQEVRFSDEYTEVTPDQIIQLDEILNQ